LKRARGAVPHVCLVAPFPPPQGGIATWTVLVTEQARRTGTVRLHLVDTAPRWRDVHDLRRWRRWAVGGAHGMWTVLSVGWQLASGCSVLHVATSGDLAVYRDIGVMLLAKVFRVPILYHLHFGRVPDIAERRSREWRMLCRALSLTSTVIVLDRRTEEVLRRQLPELRVRRVPNAVDPAPPPSPRPLDALKTVLYVGWVVAAKGVPELVQAWAAAEEPGWRLVIVGPAEESLRESLAPRCRDRRVEFAGELPRENVRRMMATAEIVTLPSHTEGFPLTILEAMACGRAIVATSVGAIPEMLDGGCGLVISPRSVAELQTALTTLMRDPAKRSELGDAARLKFEERFTLDVVFQELIGLWREFGTRPRESRHARGDHAARAAAAASDDR
jgi:glycosyltransferase involved in cell wall biosynthesis